MATDTKPTPTDTKLPAPITAPVGDGFVPLASNRLIYKAEQCHTHALQGFLLARLEMPPVGGEREWGAYVIRATQPSIALDREGKVHPVKAGDEVLLPATHVLDSDPKIQVVAKSPEWTAEVFIKPSGKISIGGGQTLWQYQSSMKPPRKRDREEAMFNLTSAIGGNPQVAGQNGQAALAAAPPF